MPEDILTRLKEAITFSRSSKQEEVLLTACEEIVRLRKQLYDLLTTTPTPDPNPTRLLNRNPYERRPNPTEVDTG